MKAAVQEKVEEIRTPATAKESSEKAENTQKADISTSETLKKEPMVEKEKNEKKIEKRKLQLKIMAYSKRQMRRKC